MLFTTGMSVRKTEDVLSILNKTDIPACQRLQSAMAWLVEWANELSEEEATEIINGVRRHFALQLCGDILESCRSTDLCTSPSSGS